MQSYKMLIGGEWIGSSDNEYIPSINPFNQDVWANIPQASEDDITRAVQAARKAFPIWSNMKGIERAELLMNLADLIDKNALRLAEIETTDNGKIIRETKNQMHFSARSYRYFAGYADKIVGEQIPLDNNEMLDYTLREPLGVVVLITSWNSPMQILSNKLAPALAAGNTVIIKPSEFASATTLEFGRLIEEAGFPKGTVNIITGDGNVGNLLTKSNKINKISFTGGTETGSKIASNASANLIPATLELGGKSPNIIFKDADLPRAINGAIAGIFGASGQTCIAGSRLLVQQSIYEQVTNELITKTQDILLGDPLKFETEMGPVANEIQYQKILDFIDMGEKQGAKIHKCGKLDTEASKSNGYFIHPTICLDVKNEMVIAQEEIFGPVLSVIPFKDDEEAIRIANDSTFGLAAGIWTQNLSRAHRISKKIESGTVWVNTYRTVSVQAPFGGVKKSGYGKERGSHALLDYTKVKNIIVDLSEELIDPFTIRT